jgi:putative hydrolase of the HAD superfamily
MPPTLAAEHATGNRQDRALPRKIRGWRSSVEPEAALPLAASFLGTRLPHDCVIRSILDMTLLMIDLDNTLIDRDAAFRTGVTEFLAAHGLPAEDVDWVMSVDASGYATRTVVADAIIERYAAGLDKAGIIDFLRRGAREHARVAEATVVALQEVREAGHQVVIVTNGTVPQQTGKITASGLDRLVDATVVSEGVGSRKPEPGIFHAAAAAVGASLDGAWMIGDRDDADILGAHRLGLRSVWLHLGRDWAPTDYKPTASADSVAEAIRHAANSLR